MVDFQTRAVRSVTIRTAWIIDLGETVRRLTSCYVRAINAMKAEIKILDPVAVADNLRSWIAGGSNLGTVVNLERRSLRGGI